LNSGGLLDARPKEHVMPSSTESSSARPATAAGPAALPGAAATPRVLIADDNPQGVELLEAYLSSSDYEIATASDGEETLRKVKQWHPDLILLDIMMPKISGFEVCKRLRNDPATRDIAVLMITALDQPSDIERAVEAGTDDFLTKPINKTEFLLRVRSLLKSRMNQRELDRALAYIDAVDRGDK
jgi:CheY-like chemotaxis protein